MFTFFYLGPIISLNIQVYSSEAVARSCSVKKGVLANFTKFTGKHLSQSLFFNKVAGGACNFIKKESLAQVFSCEFCEISKNTVFHTTPPGAASDSYRGSITRGKRIWFDFIGYAHFTSGERFWINFSTGDDVIGNVFPEVGILLRHWCKGLYQVKELVGSLVCGLLTSFYLFYLFIFWPLGFRTIYHYMNLFL